MTNRIVPSEHRPGSGLRRSSVGPDYPLTVSYRQNRQTNASAAYIWNLHTGETIAEFPYATDDREAFSKASDDAHLAMSFMTSQGVLTKAEFASVCKPSEPVLIENPPRFRNDGDCPAVKSAPNPLLTAQEPDLDKLSDASLEIVRKVVRASRKAAAPDCFGLMLAGVVNAIVEFAADEPTRKLIKQSLRD